MMYMITPKRFGECVHEIHEMHRLRYRVFKERLNWDVEVSGDLEIDRFDALSPTYLVHKGQDGRIQGCVRLLPTTGPTMLGETFPALLDGNPLPHDPRIWESSRFCLDTTTHPPKTARGVSQGFCELCSGMIEFGLSPRPYAYRDGHRQAGRAPGPDRRMAFRQGRRTAANRQNNSGRHTS